MLKWTQRHIVRYHFNFYKTEVFLQYPKPYTPCVQQFKLQQQQAPLWLLPCVGGQQWLCVQPM
jgi:hypothetical protein